MKTYKDSGVDIDAGEELVRRIKQRVRSTFTPNVLADIGAFGAFYRADFKGIRKPVLVSSVDGVGTKLKIAFAMNRHTSVGQDLVNHCVNDILVQGAKPLFFRASAFCTSSVLICGNIFCRFLSQFKTELISKFYNNWFWVFILIHGYFKK